MPEPGKKELLERVNINPYGSPQPRENKNSSWTDAPIKRTEEDTEDYFRAAENAVSTPVVVPKSTSWLKRVFGRK